MMRDRLIKLIEDFCRDKYVEKYIPTQEAYDFFIAATAFADYILADGWIRPPYRAGTKVAVITSKTSNGKNLYIFEDTITHYRIVDGCTIMCFENHLGEADWNWKNVFLTREEAEQTLKGDKDINVLCKTEKGGEQA